MSKGFRMAPSICLHDKSAGSRRALRSFDQEAVTGDANMVPMKKANDSDFKNEKVRFFIKKKQDE